MSDSRNLINISIDASGNYSVQMCNGKYRSSDIANLLEYVSSDDFIAQLTDSILIHSDPKTLPKIAQMVVANTVKNAQSNKEASENKKLARGLSPYFNPVISIRTPDDRQTGL